VRLAQLSVCNRVTRSPDYVFLTRFHELRFCHPRLADVGLTDFSPSLATHRFRASSRDDHAPISRRFVAGHSRGLAPAKRTGDFFDGCQFALKTSSAYTSAHLTTAIKTFDSSTLENLDAGVSEDITRELFGSGTSANDSLFRTPRTRLVASSASVTASLCRKTMQCGLAASNVSVRVFGRDALDATNRSVAFE